MTDHDTAAVPDEREALAEVLLEVSPASEVLARKIADAVLAAGFRRDPDVGLRERVEQAVEDVLGRTGDERLRQAMAHVRTALAEPTPGSKS